MRMRLDIVVHQIGDLLLALLQVLLSIVLYNY